MAQPRPKPKSKQPKYQVEKLDTATNSHGQVFNSGDLIQVTDLKGNPTTAKIDYFYTVPRGVMAVYSPAEDQEQGWEWSQGCSLLDSLTRV